MKIKFNLCENDFCYKKRKPTPDGVGKIAMKKKVMLNITSTKVIFNLNLTIFYR